MAFFYFKFSYNTHMDFKQFTTELDAIAQWLKKEYQSIRTGMASPAVLDGVKVDAYGAQTPINQVASISIEGAKSLLIGPYDGSLVKHIEKSIIDANLGVSVVGTDTGVRVSFPDLTAERRDMLGKLAKQKLEDARVSVRQERDKVWNEIQSKEKDGEITEDERYSLKEQMEEQVKQFNSSLDEILKNKQEEIQS